MGDQLETDAVGFNPNPHVVSASLIQEGPPRFADRYKMDHARRGRAIIFNHMKFAQCPTREGTNKDRDDLKQLFEELRFNVECYDDLTKEQLKNTLVKIAYEDHSQEDCLVVVVLSHGSYKRIYTRDSYYSPDLLWMFFDATHCTSLAGKPKLFFIQACRGEGTETGIKLRSNVEIDSVPKHNDTFYTIPTKADFLIMYSTSEDFLSWRNPTSGSYFIQSLIRQLKAHVNQKDLLSILTYVNREVAVGYSREMRDNQLQEYGHKQMCSIVSMLTREIYLN